MAFPAPVIAPLSPARLAELLAFFDGYAFNAAPRRMLHALDAEPLLDADCIGCILCFLVSPSARGQGIARVLLEAACEGLRAQGLRYAEANPRPNARTCAEQHFGPLPMYLSAGFVVDRTDADGSVWVRRQLNPVGRSGEN